MSNRLLLLLISMVTGFPGFAQLTGIKTIPGNYSSVNNAIFALNAQGVGAGGVTFLVATGYTETLSQPTSGLITATGTAANPVVFRRNGSGANPVISGCLSSATSADYVFCLQGTDYITFDGIDIADPYGLSEWGYALLKSSGTNGSQHVTIKNCAITLDNFNVNTVGIYSANFTPSVPFGQLTVTSTAGTNSTNKFYGNTISYVYNGIMLLGYDDPVAPYSNYDRGNEIGTNGANTISNFGGAVTMSNGIFTSFQTTLKVENNFISGFIEGSGGCAGIQVSTANDASADINNNTVGIDFNGLGVFYGIFNNMGQTTSGNQVNIMNNTVSHCTYPNATNGNCYYIWDSGLGQITNVSGNTVSDNTYGSTGTNSTGSLAGIVVQGTSPTVPGTMNVFSNTVQNNVRLQPEPLAGTTTYFSLNASGSALNLHDNIVNNNTVSSTGETNGFRILSNAYTKTIYGNTVSNLLDAHGIVNGFYLGNGHICYFYGNKVLNLTSNGESSVIYGVNAGSLLTSGTDFYVYNNMVGDLKIPDASGTAISIYGIYLHGTNVKRMGCYNNTVYLEASSTGVTFNTAGIFAATEPDLLEIRNNIVINRSIPNGAGKTVALWYQPAGYPNLGSNTNNNNYFAGPPSASRLIYYDGTTADQTIEAYKQRVWPRENASISEPTSFLNTTASQYDLHVNPEIPTQVESGGSVVNTPIAVPGDFDGQPRYPNTGYPENPAYPAYAPDMGADEFAGIPDDKLPPSILNSVLQNTSVLTARTLTATITDSHGVPSSGIGLPRLCWKKNYNGTWNWVTGVFTGGNKFSFTFGGGVVLGDTIRYFLTAQDQWTVPNAGSFPVQGATGFSIDPPACSVFPTMLNTYVIVNAICGTINVGAGQTYPTLSAAIADINTRELTCPVTLLLTDNDYVNETYPIFIRNIAGSSAVNTLTIKPAPGKTPLFSTYFVGTLPEYKAMLCLYGARNVILDGSNSGGQDRSMTFRNLGFGGWAAAIGLYNDGKSGASDIVIKNCVVQAHQEAVWNTQCIVTYTVAGDAGYHNITIENNTINSAKYPLQISGTIAHLTTNVRVTGNTIGSMTPNYFTTDIGVIVTQSDSVLIEGNEVIGYADGNSMQFTPVGIGIYDGSTNIRITRNTIHDCYDLISGALGMYINDPGNTNLEVTDNLIYNIKGPGYDLSPVGGGPMGVMVMAGSNMKFYNNTIHMSGDILSPDYPSSSTCIGFGGNGFTILVNDIDLRNNIFLNSMRAVAGDPGSKTYAVTTVSPNCFSVIDHNDYAVNGVGPVVGYLNADRPTLASWQAATGQDTYSVSINPAFVSTTDFHPTAALLNNKGIYLSSLPRDFSGMLRTNPPDVGIYEFGYDPVVMTGLTSANNGSSVTLNGNVTANGEFVTPYFDYGLTTAYGSTLGASPSPVTGTSQTNISADLNSLVPGATYHYRARGVTGPGMIIFGEDKIFTTMPGNLTATGTIANDTCINATQTITAGGAPNNFVVTPAGNVTMIAGHNIIFLPGSVVQQGGYLRGYITSTGQYCGANTPPLVAVRLGNTEEPADLMQSSLKVYPNPTTGTFTLELNGESRDGHASVDIFSMHGDKVFTSEIPRKGKHELSLSGMPAGIYLVRVSGSDLPGLKNPEGTTTQITARIIKQ